MKPYSFDVPSDGIRGRATAGIFKTALSQGVRLLVQLGSLVVLSRLLSPSDFGLLAMVGPIAGFASLFQDLGLTQAIVQKPHLTQAEVSALFCINLSISLGLAILLVVVSPLASWFYGEPQAGALTAAMSVGVIMGGAGSLHYALLNRRLEFGILAILDATAAVGGLAVSIAFALLYRSVWALYAGATVSVWISTCGYWVATGWCPSLPRRGSGVGASLRFGAGVTGFNAANFLARNLDNVLIGRAWGEQALGLYDRAYKLLLLPLQQINNPIAKVMLPVLSQMAGEPDRYRQAFLGTLAQMLLVTLPGVAFMVGTADLLIPLLLGRHWISATPIFAALGVASFVQVLNNPTGWLFISQNRTTEYMRWGLFGSITSVASFLIGLPYGPVGVAVAYAAGEYIRTPILWWYVTRRGPIRVRQLVRTVAPHCAGTLASLAAVAGVRALLLTTPPPVVLCACLAGSVLASMLTVAAFGSGRETIREAVKLAQHFLRMRAAS